jgi:hypothetical protein
MRPPKRLMLPTYVVHRARGQLPFDHTGGNHALDYQEMTFRGFKETKTGICSHAGAWAQPTTQPAVVHQDGTVQTTQHCKSTALLAAAAAQYW